MRLPDERVSPGVRRRDDDVVERVPITSRRPPKAREWIAVRQGFGVGRQVWKNPEIFLGAAERQPEAGQHLVENQQGPMPLGQRAQTPDEGGGDMGSPQS